jgi:uncharacterized protein with PIN domain
VEPRFLVDINVGRLAKWLRVLGYDALLAQHLDDEGLVRQSVQEGRVLLTRDRRIFQRRAAASGELKALLIRSDTLGGQLRQAVAELGLRTDLGFSRCLSCNQVLAPVAKELVQEEVPPHVYRTQQEFRRCPSCGRVYWRGTHWRNMLRELHGVRERVP